MKKFVIMYDVKADHQRIIQDLLLNDWHSILEGHSIDGEPIICFLPETTWYKEFNTQREAFDEFKAIAGADNVIRLAVTILSNWWSTATNPMGHQIEELKSFKKTIN